MQNELSFKDFNFSPEVEKGITEAGFTIPSPIQSKAIPFIMDGNDIIGQAHTGTGKTAAFALPILEKIDTREKAQALIITPTRELATQVGDEVFKLGRFKNIKTVTIYGGQSYSRQIGFLEKGAHVVVATPGRLLDLLKSGKIDLNPKFVVLDEADEMLDMGFLDDIKEIFEFLPSSRQTLLFSATMPDPIKNLAKRILNEPKFVSITSAQATNKNIDQFYYVIEEHERDNAIIRILDTLPNQKSIVFCRMKKEVDRVAQALMSAGYKATGLHGDMEQRQRETTIKGFKEDVYEILVATDVAARGIDVNGVTHVFNYHIPFDPESYVHRIGRTARGGNSGTAITLITPLEFRELERIESKIGTEIKVDYVPSMIDVQNINDKKIMELIRTQEIKTDSAEMLNLLKEEMDITHICLKLLSMVSKDKKAGGPDKIGFDSSALKALLQRRAKKDEDRRKSQGFGGRSGSRSRSGGYGGGDRNRSGGGSDRSRSGGYGTSGTEDRNRGGSDRGSSSGNRSGGGYGSNEDRSRSGGYGGGDRNRSGGGSDRSRSGGYGGGDRNRSGGGSDRGSSSGNRR